MQINTSTIRLSGATRRVQPSQWESWESNPVGSVRAPGLQPGPNPYRSTRPCQSIRRAQDGSVALRPRDAPPSGRDAFHGSNRRTGSVNAIANAIAIAVRGRGVGWLRAVERVVRHGPAKPGGPGALACRTEGGLCRLQRFGGRAPRAAMSVLLVLHPRPSWRSGLVPVAAVAVLCVGVVAVGGQRAQKRRRAGNLSVHRPSSEHHRGDRTRDRLWPRDRACRRSGYP